MKVGWPQLLILLIAACARPGVAPRAVSTEPSPFAARPRVVSVAVGGWQSCVVFDNGKGRCWGKGLFGNLGRPGLRDIGDDETPIDGDFDAGGKVSAISVGKMQMCVLLDGGTVRCWRSKRGEEGSFDTVDLGGPAMQVAVGDEHTCALLARGALRCWGNGRQGALGYGDRRAVAATEVGMSGRDVPLGGKALQVAAGDALTCALLESHAVRCWGMPPLGYPALGGVGAERTPAYAGDLDLGGPATQIAVGGAHACALLENGGVRCWGPGNNGQLGYGNEDPVGALTTPASAGDVNVGGPVRAISAGDGFSCALLESGALRCWGSAFKGKLGYGTERIIGDDEAPASAGDVPIGGKVSQVSAGFQHACALLESGAVRCWGDGSFGQLGYGNTDAIGIDDTPAQAGDVPLFDTRMRPARPIAVKVEPARPPPPSPEPLPPSPPECEDECTGCSVLFDSRAPIRRDRALSAREKRLVREAFVEHLTTGRCATDPERLPVDKIGSKEDSSYLLGVVDGSFTAPGRRQTLIGFVAGECGRPGFHAGNWGAHLTLLLDNGARLATFPDDDDAPIRFKRVRVMPGAVDQVLALSFVTGAGGSRESISLRSYADAKLLTLGRFDTASESCSFGGTTANQSITRYRWDASAETLCFGQAQREEPCPPAPSF